MEEYRTAWTNGIDAETMSSEKGKLDHVMDSSVSSANLKQIWEI